jgi:hypothetical protein
MLQLTKALKAMIPGTHRSMAIACLSILTFGLSVLGPPAIGSLGISTEVV